MTWFKRPEQESNLGWRWRIVDYGEHIAFEVYYTENTGHSPERTPAKYTYDNLAAAVLCADLQVLKGEP